MTDNVGAAGPELLQGSVQDELFPIREVARLTGVNPITLRAWERRHALIRPTRTLSGHRLYSHADVERVRCIQMWIQRGVPVGKVSAILARTQTTEPRPPLGEAPAEAGVPFWHERLRQAVADFDALALDHLYGQLLTTGPLAQGLMDVLLPLWRSLQQETQGFGGTSQWLFLDSFLRARLQLRLHLGPSHRASRLLLVGMPGQCQELELLIAGVLLGGDWVRLFIPGPRQPLEELGLVCDRLKPAAVVVYATCPVEAESLRPILRLAQGLDCPVALVGETTEVFPQMGEAEDLESLGCLDTALALRVSDWLADSERC